MKLASISLYLVALELKTPFTTSFGSYQQFQRPFLVLETADGRRGVGEVPTLSDPAYKPESDTPAVVTSLREFIIPSVISAHKREAGFDSVTELRAATQWIKGATFAKSGVEAALWDLIAQEQATPLWRLWGGDRTSFPVGVSIGGKTVEQVLELADNAVALGYQRLKIKIWPGFDVEPTAAVRERYPDLMLQVDANSSYDASNWPTLKELDKFNLLLIEQPLFDDDVVLHSHISREVVTPICLDESIHSLRDAETAMRLWARNDKLDRLVINIKPPRVSGFQEAIAIANSAHKYGVKSWIGGMLDSAWGKALNLNFNGLTDIELPGDHFSPSGAYFVEDLTREPLSAPEGVFTLTDQQSTGAEFDWDTFSRLGQLIEKWEFTG